MAHGYALWRPLTLGCSCHRCCLNLKCTQKIDWNDWKPRSCFICWLHWFNNEKNLECVNIYIYIYLYIYIYILYIYIYYIYIHICVFDPVSLVRSPQILAVRKVEDSQPHRALWMRPPLPAPPAPPALPAPPAPPVPPVPAPAPADARPRRRVVILRGEWICDEICHVPKHEQLKGRMDMYTYNYILYIYITI